MATREAFASSSAKLVLISKHCNLPHRGALASSFLRRSMKADQDKVREHELESVMKDILENFKMDSEDLVSVEDFTRDYCAAKAMYEAGRYGEAESMFIWLCNVAPTRVGAWVGLACAAWKRYGAEFATGLFRVLDEYISAPEIAEYAALCKAEAAQGRGLWVD